MKLPHALTLTAITALALTSCDTTDNGASPASLADPRVKISNIDIGPINPDDIQTAYTGTNLGLFLEYSDRNPNKQHDVSNVYWGYNTDTYEWEPETDVVWRGAGYGVNVYVYAPYSASVDDFKSLDFKIPFDQSGGTAEADLLTGSRYHFMPSRDLNELGQIDITLNHALIKLIVNTTLGDQYEGTSVGGLIGHTYHSDIVHSSVYGKMRFLGTQTQGGGLIGSCYVNSKVSRCHFGGPITYDNDPENRAASFFGFVAPYNTIEQCTYSKTSGITRAAMTYGQTDYRDNIKGI